MKSSHKLYAATGGLMIAALMGYAGAFAADTPTVDAADTQPIEVSSASSTTASDDTFNLEGITPEETAETKDDTAVEPSSEATDSEAAPAEEAPAESTEKVVPEESAPGLETTVDSTDVSGEAAPAAPTKDSTIEADESEATADATAAEEVVPAEEAPAEADVAEEAPFEVSPAEETKKTATSATEVKSAPVVPVTYVAPRHSSIVPDFAVDVVLPDPKAEAPLLTMAKTENVAPAPDANGDSQVVWFALPEPAGPALVPGQATPLLNAAVSEAAASVNANVVPATAVQQGGAVQASQQNVAPASAKAVTESGTLSRGLARTGSIAQYASLLSAGALILGVALLAGAIATTRRNSHLVDAE